MQEDWKLTSLINLEVAAKMLGWSLPRLARNRDMVNPIPFVKKGKFIFYELKDIEEYLKLNPIDKPN